MLSKKKVLLSYIHTTGMHAFFGPDEEDREIPSVTLYLPEWDWHDMGSPQEITVTIVPGDELNPKDTDRGYR